MRLLQDVYWPNDYLLSYLSGLDLKSNDKIPRSITACINKSNNQIYRCNGFSYDIINIIEKTNPDLILLDIMMP